MKVMDIPVVIGALGNVFQKISKRLEDLEISGKFVKKLQ